MLICISGPRYLQPSVIQRDTTLDVIQRDITLDSEADDRVRGKELLGVKRLEDSSIVVERDVTFPDLEVVSAAVGKSHIGTENVSSAALQIVCCALARHVPAVRNKHQKGSCSDVE